MRTESAGILYSKDRPADRLMLLRPTITVCSANHTNHINNAVWAECRVLVNAGGAYCNHNFFSLISYSLAYKIDLLVICVSFVVWTILSVRLRVQSSRNVMAHGDGREGKWRGNWRMEWVARTLHTTSEHGASSITTADAHTSAAVVDWNDAPVHLKEPVRFAERRNLVSARVPSRFKPSLPVWKSFGNFFTTAVCLFKRKGQNRSVKSLPDLYFTHFYVVIYCLQKSRMKSKSFTMLGASVC